MDIINKYKLKLILDNKTVLLIYILLMILNFMLITDFIFDKTKINITPENINTIYIAIIICIFINLLLIHVSMKSNTFEINIFNREFTSKTIYILFTFLQSILAILTIIILLYSKNNYTNKQKYSIITQIIIINFIAISTTWILANNSCNIIDK